MQFSLEANVVDESATIPPPAHKRPRLSLLSGLSFVLLFFASLVMLGDLAGSFADSDALFIDYHSSQSNQIQVVVGGYVITAAGLALLIFLTGQAAPTSGRNGHPLHNLALASGMVGVALWLAGGAALMMGATAKTFGSITGDAPLTGDGVAVAPQLGYVLIFLSAMWALACSIAAQTWCVWTASTWPAWLRWLSVTTVIALLLGAALFVPLIMLPIWVGAVSVFERRRLTRAPAS